MEDGGVLKCGAKMKAVMRGLRVEVRAWEMQRLELKRGAEARCTRGMQK